MKWLSLVSIVLAASLRAAVPLPAPTTVPVNGPLGEVNLLAMGDWGRANAGQKAVAETMAVYAQRHGNIQGMLLAGDNFYVKLASTDDPNWKSVFENVYDARRLSFPFFAALGNHDYEGDKAAIEMAYTQDHPDSRFKMPARWYRVNIPAERPLVSVLMLDSNKPLMPPVQWTDEKAWIEKELSATPAGTWTICCAHHPLFSNGSHGDVGPLQTEWGPLLQKHHVAFFVCGHDHDLQHLEVSGWSESFLLVGGGGAETRAMRKDNRGPFSKALLGFAHFQVTPERAIVRFIDKNGQTVHAFERSAEGKVQMMVNTPSDPPTTKPLQNIQGIGDKKADD